MAVKSDLVLLAPEPDDPLIDPTRSVQVIHKQPHVRLSIDLTDDNPGKIFTLFLNASSSKTKHYNIDS